MSHRAEYSEKIVLVDKEPVRVVFASYKGLKMSVVRDTLTYKWVRNITIYGSSGWLFQAPTDKIPYTQRLCGLENWFELTNMQCNLCGKSEQTLKQIIEVFSQTKYKEFVYTLKAMKTNATNHIFEVFKLWLIDKKVELLVKADYPNLINKKFLAFSKEKQRKVIKLLVDSKAPKYASINELETMVVHNCSYEATAYGGDDKLISYLKEQKENYMYYRDYIKLAKELKKNLKDSYWRYPKNLRAKHIELNEEKEEMERIKELKKQEELNNQIISVSESLKKLERKINGYEIRFPQSYEDIVEQAKVLHQCLITCSYYKSYAEKKLILVFIVRKGKRIATAEIENGKIEQFYANEKDRNHCKPTPKTKEAFNQWFTEVYKERRKICIG